MKLPPRSGAHKFQQDPYWRDCIQFYAYFHDDNGAGIGASHQTGWTGVIARAMHLFASVKADEMLQGGKTSYFKTQSLWPEKRETRRQNPNT